MLAAQRATVILRQLSLRQTIRLKDLCQITGASEATIRRNLKALEQQRQLVRVHGGAATLDGEVFLEREPDLAIARYAASLVVEGDVVYLDTGTTILPLDAAQIITDSLPDRKYLDYTEVIVA